MRIETEEQKKSRIFDHYKQYIKKPVNKGGCIRFIVIEYVVRITDIDPFKMAAELKKMDISLLLMILAYQSAKTNGKEKQLKKSHNWQVQAVHRSGVRFPGLLYLIRGH